MKIKFLATGIAPNFYEFDGEKIIFNGETYDLSQFEEGDIFEGLEGEIQGIRAVERVDGELYVTLCQKAPPGHWTGVDEYMDSNDYDPNTLYIREKAPKEMQEVAEWGM
ncbi:MAG TPA: hypothetical protein VFF56_01360 [Bacillota bacterium]|nr:hypothetical protein [Bacillota bacterium]